MKLIKPSSISHDIIEVYSDWERKPAQGLPGLFGFTEPDYDNPRGNAIRIAGRAAYSTCIIDFENDPVPFYDVIKLGSSFNMKNTKVDLEFGNLTYYGVWTHESLRVNDNVYECYIDYLSEKPHART